MRRTFYTERMRKLDRSRLLQQRAERLLPGGVDSPVRAFRAVGGDPPFLVRAEGAYLWDADGNRYIDYFGSWGPMILGHAFPPVVEAIQQAAARSASFGASTASEADLAELIRAAVPSMEKLRFVSSGTEATMSAIRLARAFTNRKYILKFEGCYHGHADGLLVKAGSGVATFGIPGSAGVPEEIAHFTLALRYNDIAAVEASFAARPNEIAAIILEPVAGNMGCVPPEPAYLVALRELTTREGAVLIFDEVMTGFRVAHGGAQQLYGITPDMTCLGKIIGGGLPCGAFGGRAEIMNLLAPLGPVYQAGTLSGNPLGDGGGRRHACISRNQQAKRCTAIWRRRVAWWPKASPQYFPKPASRSRPTGWVRCGRGSSPTSAWSTLRRRRLQTPRASARFTAPCWMPACGCHPRSLKRSSSARRTRPKSSKRLCLPRDRLWLRCTRRNLYADWLRRQH